MEHRSQALCSTTVALGSKRSKGGGSSAAQDEDEAVGTLEDLDAAKVTIVFAV